nr:DyP-type peroxidase [Auricularia auricula-judae]
MLLNTKRRVNMLQNIPGQVPLPLASAVVSLNITNIQGDILVGMKKKQELFYFFSINNASSFRQKLHANVAPQITSAQQLLSTSTQPVVALNIAFSQTGLRTLGVTDNIADPSFGRGQFAEANSLGDPDQGAGWLQPFQGTAIHGVFLMASDNQTLLDAQVAVLETRMGTDMTRPHIDGFGQAFPGQLTVNPGVILCGETGDSLASRRPAWMKDGSFMAFRQLQQKVPEWNRFIASNAPNVSGLTRAQSVTLMGARLMGRWKSGAPVDLSPLFDNATLGADPKLNNNFDYTHAGSNIDSDQTRCPFGAHVRKTRPRADLSAPDNSIMRAGIPYGPEVTDDELTAATSTLDRGLAFVSYQSQIAKGFRFIQTAWANGQNFPFGKSEQPGFDPVVGANRGRARLMSGYNVSNTAQELSLQTDFVISKGGEYFFVPSISALRTM